MFVTLILLIGCAKGDFLSQVDEVIGDIARLNWPSLGRYGPPVVFIPGLEGSNLDLRVQEEYLDHPVIRICPTLRHVDWQPFYINIEPKYFISPDYMACIEYGMSLHYNITDHKTYNSPGVEVRVSGNKFGTTRPVEDFVSYQILLSPYMATLFEYMTIFGGYRRDQSLVAAPYDWRKGPNEILYYFKELKWLIEDTYNKNNRQKVVILGQSMGCLYAVHFLNQQEQKWKDKYIQRLVAVSGPYGGTVTTLESYTKGLWTEFLLTGKDKFRKAQSTMPSVAYLMPNLYGFGLEDVFIRREWAPNVTLRNMTDFVETVGNEYIRPILQDQFGMSNRTHPGVPISCFYSYGRPTTEQLIYQRLEDFPRNPMIVQGDGDGLVNRKSLEVCKIWAKQNKYDFEVVALEGLYEHSAFVTDPKAISIIFGMIMK